MNRIDRTFAELRRSNQSALVPYITVGDPDMATTLEIVEALADSGADLIELGVPFSDPTSDGPALQRSAEIALRAGASLPRTLEMVAAFRARSQVPIVLYGYYNPIFRYGPERFARDAKQAGVDGVLVVDLPPEEVHELTMWTKPQGLHFVFLLAPTSGEDRIAKVLRLASGFIYYVSLTGVTGVQSVRPENVQPVVEAIQAQTSVPVGVGFGISTPEQARAVAAFADATVVGTAIMRQVDTHRGSDALVSRVATFVSDLKAGVASARRSS